MIRNKLKALWAEGRPAMNGWLSIGNAFTAEIMAAQGYDSLTIDAQHGALDYAAALPMLQAMRASGVVPMVRVPWCEPGIIMKMLDAGAYGIICPMINTAEQAADFVSYMRYPPKGQRSFGPTRANFSAGANYAAEANGEILAFAMIETREAMDNLDAIAATPGLDGLYRTGGSDLQPRRRPPRPRLRPRGAGDGRGDPDHPRRLPEERPARRDPLRHARLRRQGHRLGLRPDHRRRRFPPPRRRRQRKHRPLPPTHRQPRRRSPEKSRRKNRPHHKRRLLMPHVLIAGKLHKSGIELLSARPDLTFDYVEEVSEPSCAALIDKADALVIRTQPLSAATVAKAGRLRIVSRHGVGYNSVDLPALNARGIALAVVGDVNSISVAEQAMMLLLAAAKRALRADRAVRSGEWTWRNGLEPRELWGKRLLIVGYGRAGRHLARMAGGFGMEIRAHDPFLAARGWPEGPVTPADLAEGLAWADFVSVHAPKTEKPVIGAAELATMKPSAILVNTARGGVVDEEALIAALAEGRLAGAGLDVFDAEPPVPGNPLLKMDNVVLSPHVAGLTTECAERMAVGAVQNVLDFLDGKPDTNLIVNHETANA